MSSIARKFDLKVILSTCILLILSSALFQFFNSFEALVVFAIIACYLNLYLIPGLFGTFDKDATDLFYYGLGIVGALIFFFAGTPSREFSRLNLELAVASSEREREYEQLRSWFDTRNTYLAMGDDSSVTWKTVSNSLRSSASKKLENVQKNVELCIRRKLAAAIDEYNNSLSRVPDAATLQEQCASATDKDFLAVLTNVNDREALSEIWVKHPTYDRLILEFWPHEAIELTASLRDILTNTAWCGSLDECLNQTAILVKDIEAKTIELEKDIDQVVASRPTDEVLLGQDLRDAFWPYIVIIGFSLKFGRVQYFAKVSPQR